MADIMIEEALRPLVTDSEKYRCLGFSLDARHSCLGIVLGLYHFDQERETGRPITRLNGPGD